MINNTAIKNLRSLQTNLTDLSQNSSYNMCPNQITNENFKQVCIFKIFI